MREINGVHEVIREEPFELLLSNFSKEERKLPKGMVIAYAAPSPLALITLAGKAAKEMAPVLNIAPIEAGAPLPKDWKDLVDLSHITDEKLKARIL